MEHMSNLKDDKVRYGSNKMPAFQYYLRLSQETKGIARTLFTLLYRIVSKFNNIEIPTSTKIDGGLYIGHPYSITINPLAVLGKNINIHKGVTIGQENRGKRKGTPTIKNDVWIGVNTVIVGNITIGDDVLIAPNSFVNCDIPPHSIVFGNPCTIRSCSFATKDYINNRIR